MSLSLSRIGYGADNGDRIATVGTNIPPEYPPLNVSMGWTGQWR
ncbi:hypothetical protein [Chloroflexus sp. Y-396-1]|nr:hypothetical protein [Chloroflexus sp. Y-396-1]